MATLGPVTDIHRFDEARLARWLADRGLPGAGRGLKVLQYMAAGLPVVANPVGVHAEMVRHGETGYLATTAEEWVAAVRRLAADPDLRRRMGRAGRERVEACYSVRAGAGRWAEVLAALEGREVPLCRCG